MFTNMTRILLKLKEIKQMHKKEKIDKSLQQGL